MNSLQVYRMLKYKLVDYKIIDCKKVELLLHILSIIINNNEVNKDKSCNFRKKKRAPWMEENVVQKT